MLLLQQHLHFSLFPLYKRTAPVIEQTNEAQQKGLPTQTVVKPFYRGILSPFYFIFF